MDPKIDESKGSPDGGSGAGNGAKKPDQLLPAVAVGVDRATGRRRAIRRAWLRGLPVLLVSLVLH
jgi:hypothetical protein